ncbi:Transport inhibitor response 1-like protein [Rhynchospora pubera]|uniref:Transport inhibitor response 1-like protein n=1 Tax=Rhynchospora pubera TaxID=906938 RepID=A0AAV8DGK6_9POAL|nr:Transport inhibitor response 1-like protein [Rhynchospora pubera]
MSEEEPDDSDEHRRPATTSSSSAPPFSDQVLENVLETVLQFITSPRDRNACSLVCRLWNRTESLTRQHLVVGNLYSINPTRAVTRFPNIQSLSLKGRPRFADFGLVPPGWGAGFTAWGKALVGICAGSVKKLVLKRVTVSNSDLELIGRGLPSFGDLTLICCDGFGSPGLGAVVENCKQLRVLDLIDCDIEDDNSDDLALVDWISKFPRTHNCLESLSFECISYAVNLDALESLIVRSPNLCRLRVNSHITISQLCRLLLRAPQLTHLGTGMFCTPGNENEEMEAKDVEAVFGSMKDLIYLSGLREIKPELLPTIYPVCGQLTTLNLSYAVISAEQLKPVIRHCHNLQIFWTLDTIGDEGLKAVATTCRDLRELRVFPQDPSEESEGFVSDLGLIYISEGCRKLRSILYFCQLMTNAAVIAMSVNCPDLTVFRLCIMGRHRPDRSTGGPMDEGFGEIVKNCKKLRRLAVSGLLTDRAFGLFGKYGKTIRTLSVAFGGNSDLALKYVLEGCHNLQKLEIRDSPFSDAGLLAGIGHFYNMRFVWLNSCRLTARGCREVARRLPHMVVEVIEEPFMGIPGLDDDDPVEKLYMYRSLAGPRDDAPQFVKIL